MATTAMMCPIADALLNELEHSQTDQSEEKSRDKIAKILFSVLFWNKIS